MSFKTFTILQRRFLNKYVFLSFRYGFKTEEQSGENRKRSDLTDTLSHPTDLPQVFHWAFLTVEDNYLPHSEDHSHRWEVTWRQQLLLQLSENHSTVRAAHSWLHPDPEKWAGCPLAWAVSAQCLPIQPFATSSPPRLRTTNT